MTYAKFSKRVLAAGLRPRECSPVHWRIEGGAFDVNFYPTRGTVYVNGMAAKGRAYTVADLIAIARSGPSWTPTVKAARTKYRHAKTVLARIQKHCFWCGCEFTKEVRPTADHLIPLSRGGSNALDNLVLACAPCNERRKNDLPPAMKGRAKP